ncbi:hypothetical protein SDC9_124393 [bioreactor metagenome]|uniref:Uncharacterized protein n=1 Tax=bioreactor metagenome TaxID=1076179 RepID=A0A645CKA0_9ZZZZ
MLLLSKNSSRYLLPDMSKIASISALFLPFLIKSLEDLSPNIRDKASIKTDLPEPVSPVKTLNPFSKLIVSFSNTAKLLMFKLISILSPLSYILFKFLKHIFNTFQGSDCHKYCVISCQCAYDFINAHVINGRCAYLCSSGYCLNNNYVHGIVN